MSNDEQIRQQALDPSQSFIVQAPAGSGKTELLTQRFLKLLCHTRQSPEEVIAITFTRKAAGEMRERILSSLAMAENDIPPEETHKKITWELARNALKRDKALQWNLQNNPNRLRILTIDALAGHIAKQIPLTARLSPQLSLTENAWPFYRQAVQQVILSIGDTPCSEALENLLMHLDNKVYQLESLLMKILSKREQWLPHIANQKNNTLLKQQMEQGLQNIASEKIENLMPYITDDIACELIPLAHFAGQYCQAEDPNNPIAIWHHMQNLPGKTAESLPYWQAIAHIFLTLKGEWRKSITKRQGFPANEKEIKAQLKSLLPELQKNDALRNALFEIAQCPPLHYNDQQWKIVQSLIEVLPLLAAQLNIIFQEKGTSDFVELNLAALRALGEPDNPTDLALYLDHQITHLLVDEFQDTSVMQFELVERLLSGWSKHDGRTVFLVGDPMQSIYRFRNAEVGLFLRTQEQGIANLSLTTLKLEKNFRSTPDIVDWTNQNFHTIFPSHVDIASGGVPHAPAIAANNHPNGIVNWHALLNDDGQHEAQTIVNIIKEKQKSNPKNTIAILVRSRSQLTDIIPELHKNKLNFKAIDIDPLNDCIEIQDAHTLTRALLHRADRIAWLALLRAPYCGLKLKDLLVIAQNAKNTTIYQTLKNIVSSYINTPLSHTSTPSSCTRTPSSCTSTSSPRVSSPSSCISTPSPRVSSPSSCISTPSSCTRTSSSCTSTSSPHVSSPSSCISTSSSRGLTAGSRKNKQPLDPAVKPRDDEVLSQDSETLGQNGEILAQDSETLTQDDEILAQDSETLGQDGEILAQDSETLTQDNEILAQSSETLEQDEGVLAQGNKTLMQNNELSSDAKKRLEACFPVLYNAIENFGRMPLSQTIKTLWFELNAESTLENETQRDNVIAYFKLIENIEQNKTNISLSDIEEKLSQLYAESNPKADDCLQVMTIHKSKGLEFDHVILPGLNQKTSHDPLQLLMWLERPNMLGHSDLILAPIKSASEYQDPIYQYLRRIEKTKSDHETARLLYVATTRAKQSIDFIASTSTDEEDPEKILPPKKRSFLELLWNITPLNFIECEPLEQDEQKTQTLPALKRFSYESLKPKTIDIVLKN